MESFFKSFLLSHQHAYFCLPIHHFQSVGHIRVVPLLHLLAEYLAKEAGHLIHITNVIIHARVPIIKAVSVDPQLSGAHPNNSGSGSGSGSNGGSGSAAGFTPLHCEGSKYEPISIDISIDSPLHSGLATTEMVCTLMQALPPLGPVVSVVKDYLKLKGLSDAFTGGLNSYGLFILMLLPLLRRLRDSRDLLGCEPIGGVPVQVPVPVTAPAHAPAPGPATAPTPATAAAPGQASSTGTVTGCPASAVPVAVSTTDAALSDAASNSKVHIDKVPAPSTSTSASTRANVSELKSAGACQGSKQGAVRSGLVAGDAKCIGVDPSSTAKGSAPSSLSDNAVKGSDRKAPLSILTAQDTGRTCDCDNGLVKGLMGPVNRVGRICLDCSNIKAGTAAVVVSDKSSSSSRHLEGQTSDDSQGEAGDGDGAVQVSSSSSKASDQQGGGGKVTSVYMQAVARAAQAQSQRMAGTNSTKGGHLAKGSLNKRLKDLNLTIPASASASSSSEGEDTVVRDAIPVPLSLGEKARGGAGIHCLAGRALSSIQAGGSATCSDESAAISDSGDIELSLEPIGGDTTLPLSLNTSVNSALSPASPRPSTPQVCEGDTNKHSHLPSSLSASPSSKPMLSSRPPLRPTPPVTLKEYLSVKHSLHSTYTVARSALKPSQSNNVPLPQSPPHQPSPASPKYKPSPPSSTTSASTPSSSSVSTPPKASGPSYDTSPGIALHCSTVNVMSFPAVFTNTHASSGAMATYQYLRPKPPSPFSRQHNISPIATPKQSLGQMQLSSNAKFPMRIIFPSPPFSSPYKHSSGPSSSSISKAGALYIMNVMNNQRGYTWNNLKQQRDFGRKVAFKLFDLPDNGEFNRGKPSYSSKHNYRNSAREMRVPCVLALEAPILGSLLQDFLLAYGSTHHGF